MDGRWGRTPARWSAQIWPLTASACHDAGHRVRLILITQRLNLLGKTAHQQMVPLEKLKCSAITLITPEPDRRHGLPGGLEDLCSLISFGAVAQTGKRTEQSSFYGISAAT